VTRPTLLALRRAEKEAASEALNAVADDLVGFLGSLPTKVD